MEYFLKCERSNCRFAIHPDPNNNNGRYCCKACMENNGHGQFCKRQSNNNFIVIATLQTYEEPYNKLRESLKNANIDDSVIITVYANEPENKVEGNVIRMRNNLYEYTAFLGIHLGNFPQNSSFLLLHDTSTVGPKFKQCWGNFCREHTGDILWAEPKGLCNICIFNKKFAEAVYNKFIDKLTIEKTVGIEIEINKHPDSLKRIKLAQNFSKKKSKIIGEEVVYSNNVKRLIRYYSSLDLYKNLVAPWKKIGKKIVHLIHPEKP